MSERPRQTQPNNDEAKMDEWDVDLARHSLRTAMLTLEMLTATGRDGGEKCPTRAYRDPDKGGSDPGCTAPRS